MREHPPGADMDLVTGQGQQRGVYTVTGHGTEAGTWCREQRQEAKARGWWVWVTSSWTELYAWRGGGKRVQERGSTLKNDTDREAVG